MSAGSFAVLRECADFPLSVKIVITGDKVSPDLAKRLIMLIDKHLYLTSTLSKEQRLPFLKAAGINTVSGADIDINDIVVCRHSLREFDTRHQRDGTLFRALGTQQILPDKFAADTRSWISPAGDIRGEFTETNIGASDVFYDLNNIALRYGDELNLRCQVIGLGNTPLVEFRIEKSKVASVHVPSSKLTLPPLKAAGWVTSGETIQYHVGEKKFMELCVVVGAITPVSQS